jgi:hypothetical protein
MLEYIKDQKKDKQDLFNAIKYKIKRKLVYKSFIH